MITPIVLCLFAALLSASPDGLGNVETWNNPVEASHKLSTRLLDLSPKDNRNVVRAGALELWAGNDAEAARLFERAVELDRDDDDAYLEIVRAYIAAGGHEEQVRSWAARTEEVAVDEKDDATIVSLAWYFAFVGEWDQVDRLFQEAMTIDPKDLDNELEWAATELMRGDRDGAILRMIKALDEKPKAERLVWKAGQVLNGTFTSFYAAGMNPTASRPATHGGG